MSGSLEDYFAALERLKKRKEKINNDTVSVEAGRKKGSIKKSRPQFASLIAAIDEAALGATAERNEPNLRLEKVRDEKKDLQQRLDDALEREICLLKEVFDLKQELVTLRGGTVLPIRKKRLEKN
ncbi:hypothetical protein [Paraburkholderia sp. D1E]|uniref:hypothetical protein n=1 Tax=Paraburkholderia sp. D1E TaxID=3461398 RepID=UPI0040453DE6